MTTENERDYIPKKSIVSRLLIKLDSKFFSRAPKEQDQLRQHFLYHHRALLNGYLFRELFDLKFNPNDEGEDPLSDNQLHLLNAHTTAICGIGDNSFWLNEMQGPEFDLTSFNSLYDYDLAEFKYQIAARKTDDSKPHEEILYRLYLNHNWARLLDENQCFHYSTISSLAFYIFDQLQEAETDIIQALIPYSWEEGENHNIELPDGNVRWDLNQNANGREKELDELSGRVRQYQNQRLQDLNEEFHHIKTGVYLVKTLSHRDGPVLDVIVNNSKSAKQITFKSFLNDCISLVRPHAELEELIKHELRNQELFIQKAYEDICEKYDPSVIKLKSQSKILLSLKAFTTLNRISEDESDGEYSDE